MVTFSAPCIARAIAVAATALAITLGGAPSTVGATNTTSITTSASVAPDCKFNTDSYEIGIPALDTVNGTTFSDGSQTIYITCNEGTKAASTIELGADAGKHTKNAQATKRAMKSGDGKLFLDYKLGLSPGGTGPEFPICSSEACEAGKMLTPILPNPTTSNNEDAYKFLIYAYVASSYTQTAVAGDNSYTDNVKLYVDP